MKASSVAFAATLAAAAAVPGAMLVAATAVVAAGRGVGVVGVALAVACLPRCPPDKHMHTKVECKHEA